MYISISNATYFVCAIIGIVKLFLVGKFILRAFINIRICISWGIKTSSKTTWTKMTDILYVVTVEKHVLLVVKNMLETTIWFYPAIWCLIIHEPCWKHNTCTNAFLCLAVNERCMNLLDIRMCMENAFQWLIAPSMKVLNLNVKICNTHNKSCNTVNNQCTCGLIPNFEAKNKSNTFVLN